MAKLGDICFQITDGSHNPPAGIENSKHLMLSSKNINDDEITTTAPRFLTDEQFDIENKRTNVLSGDLLMTIVGTVGRVAVVPEMLAGICLQRSVAVIKPNPTIINNRYLMYQLQSMRKILESEARGVAQKGIYLKQVGDLSVITPPLDEQYRVVDTLDHISGLIHIYQQQLTKLDELIKARFVEVFGDMLLNSLEWPEKSLESLADIVSGITKGRKTTETELIEVPYMAVSNVKSGYIDWTTVKTILATKQEIEQYRLMPDDILMTEGGDPDKVGRGAIIKNPLKDSIHQNHIFRVRLDKSELLPAYFAEYLQHQKAKRYFLGCAKQTTGIASINMRQLRALPVLIPPLPLQNQFAAFVAEVDKSKADVQKALDQTQLLFDSLMQQYFG